MTTGAARDRPAPTLSVIVPAFNEARTIRQVIERLLEVDLPADREILVVDDGSTDGTSEVLESVRGPDVRLLRLPRNEGKGAAVRRGFTEARGAVLAIQDADLELDPSDLAALVRPVIDGEADVVYGSRFLGRRPNAPWTTIAANRFLTAVTNLLFGASLTDMETCYKVMRAEVARSLRLESDRFDIEPEMTAKLLKKGLRIVERPVRFEARRRSAGKKIGWRDGLQAIWVLVRIRVAKG